MAVESPPLSETTSLPTDSTNPADAAGPADAISPQSDDNDGGEIDAAAIDELLRSATFDDPAPDPGSTETEPIVARATLAEGDDPADDAEDFHFPDLQRVVQDAQVSSIDLLRDVDLDVKIELGRSHMLVEDVLKLAEGSVVELDKLAGDPVDVFVNERLIARGEVLVLNDNFCVRINEIVAGVRLEGV